MINQIITLACLVAAAYAGAIGIGSVGLGDIGLGGLSEGFSLGAGIATAPIGIAKQQIIDFEAPAQYGFKYGVEDPKTGDRKQQSEIRVGDAVKGEYSLAEPDGTIRVVKYTADKVNGFNAIVERIGAAAHPQILVQKTLAVPTIATKGLSLGSLDFGGGLQLGSLRSLGKL